MISAVPVGKSTADVAHDVCASTVGRIVVFADTIADQK